MIITHTDLCQCKRNKYYKNQGSLRFPQITNAAVMPHDQNDLDKLSEAELKRMTANVVK